MAIGSIYKVAVLGSGGFGQQLVCSFHYRQEFATIFDTPSEDLVQAWDTDLTTLWRDLLPTSTVVTGLEVRGITDPLEGFDFSFPSALPGTRAGDPLPPQCAPVLTWTTGLVGRRFRGRSYLWYPVEGDSIQGQLLSGYQAAASAFATASQDIGDDITTASYTQGVWSQTFSVFTPISGFRVNLTIGTQRRRVPGRGA